MAWVGQSFWNLVFFPPRRKKATQIRLPFHVEDFSGLGGEEMRREGKMRARANGGMRCLNFRERRINAGIFRRYRADVQQINAFPESATSD